MADLFTYSPTSMVAFVGAYPVTGFSDGEFISLKPNAMASTFVPGVDGSGTRIKGIDISWTCKLLVQQEHFDNAFLKALQVLTRSNQVEVTTLDIFPMSIMRKDTLEAWITESAWIEEFTPETFGTDEGSQMREYIFRWRDLKHTPAVRQNTPIVGSVPNLQF